MRLCMPMLKMLPASFCVHAASGAAEQVATAAEDEMMSSWW